MFSVRMAVLFMFATLREQSVHLLNNSGEDVAGLALY